MDELTTCIKQLREQIARIPKETNAYWESRLKILPKLDDPKENRNNKRRPELVLKSEMRLELGGPGTDSCGMVLYTSDRDMVLDGLLTVIGPDIPDVSSRETAYGQVILIAGAPLDKSMYYEIQKAIDLSCSIPGYMSKRNGVEIWDRVSEKAVKNGLDFSRVAGTLMQQIKDRLSEVAAVEILILTGHAEVVKPLQEIGKKAETSWKKLKKQLWSSRGLDLDACSPGGHCGACDDKETCDKIRQISKNYSETKQLI